MQIEAALAGPFPADAQSAYRLALRGRIRRPAALEPLADHLLQLAGSDDAAAGRALVVHGWAQCARGQFDAARHTADQAMVRLGTGGEGGALALGHDLLAQLAHVEGRFEEAIAHGLTVAAQPEGSRLPQEWSATLSRLAGSHERLGRNEEALRWHYRALPMAAASGDPVAYAVALSGAGGLQLSLLNVEDAALLCEQAWGLVRDHPPGYAWGLCATNWAMVLMLQQRYPEGLELAGTIVAADAALGAPSRYLRLLLLGELSARGGDTGRAQELLDQGLALHPFGPAPPLHWVRGQSHLWNAVGRHADALALCRAALARTEPSRDGGDLDYDRLHQNLECARALEQMGDLPGALQAQRAAADAERRMAAAAMRARRLTLQIQFDLDLARRERDLALQREQAAAREQQRLTALNQELAAATAAKSRFLAAASHDLRQPLHALGLQLAHLRSGAEGEERVAVEQRMEAALDSLNRMFDTLLDISRMDAGVVAPRRQRLALLPLLARLVDEMQPVARLRGLRLTLHAVGERFTDSDPALLETLLRNLLANALKYTPRGGVLLALRDRGPALALEVWDTGIGIAAEEQARVFDEFYQVGGAAAASSQGLGLGLAIVRRLSQLLEHSLQLDSRPGRGTRFRVGLPCLPGPGRADVPAELPPDPTAPRALQLAVIEDDLEVRESLVALLQRWGHQVLAAGSTAELLPGLAAGSRLDAVIADYRLQGGATGDHEVAQLRAVLGRSLPALIVSGTTAAADLRALADGGLPWLSKPLQPARLRAWLRSCASTPPSGLPAG